MVRGPTSGDRAGALLRRRGVVNVDGCPTATELCIVRSTRHIALLIRDRCTSVLDGGGAVALVAKLEASIREPLAFTSSGAVADSDATRKADAAGESASRCRVGVAADGSEVACSSKNSGSSVPIGEDVDTAAVAADLLIITRAGHTAVGLGGLDAGAVDSIATVALLAPLDAGHAYTLSVLLAPSQVKESAYRNLAGHTTRCTSPASCLDCQFHPHSSWGR